PLFELGGELFGLLLVDRLGRLLYQADDIPHAEDAPGDAFGMNLFERLDPLADPDQHDRLAGNGAHRQGRTAPRIAVDPGQHDRRDAGALAKGFGDIDRILPGHAVGDDQVLVGVGGRAHRRHFEHQLFVDVEPPGGVENYDIIPFG